MDLFNSPLVIATIDDAIIEKRIRESGFWDKYQELISRAKEARPEKGCIKIDRVEIDPEQGKNLAVFYLYHYGFQPESDNGWLLFQIINPAVYPDIVEMVNNGLNELLYDRELLWSEDLVK